MGLRLVNSQSFVLYKKGFAMKSRIVLQVQFNGGIDLRNDKLTVAQVAELLTAPQLSAEVIGRLKADKRIAVAKLLERWLKQQDRVAVEEQRLNSLYTFEREYYVQGCQFVAGVDEAGRGPLAGPVVVGAVILPPEYRLPLLNDSKQLTPSRRAELYSAIQQASIAVRIAVIDVDIIDTINIYQATVKGMYQALFGLSQQPEAVLIDAVPLSDLAIPNRSLIDGDALSASIAAASIIAKVERDRIMTVYDAQYPHYGFARHKGYATREHRLALEKYGPCPIHRKTFEPIKSMIASQYQPLF